MCVHCFSCEGVHSQLIVHSHLLFILCLFYFRKYSLVHLLGLCVFTKSCCFLFVVIAN